MAFGLQFPDSADLVFRQKVCLEADPERTGDGSRSPFVASGPQFGALNAELPDFIDGRRNLRPHIIHRSQYAAGWAIDRHDQQRLSFGFPTGDDRVTIVDGNKTTIANHDRLAFNHSTDAPAQQGFKSLRFAGARVLLARKRGPPRPAGVLNGVPP
ncbi:hypothetical protein N3929_26680 [Bosea sp. SSUT22]|nr:hypothetical protein [Bosea spartocytisi]MCT4475298.1 hypothetical protein [Bosea spartocytisi]